MPRRLIATRPPSLPGLRLLVPFLAVLSVTSVYPQVQQTWVARYNGAGNNHDIPYGIAVDTAGNVYVTGNSIEGPNVQSFTTVKYSSAGVEQWVGKTGTHSGGGQAIAVTPAGDICVAGNINFGAPPGGGGGTNGDFCIIKYDASGAQQWLVTYNGPQNSTDYAKALAVDSAGNVYVTGASPGLTTAYDIATVKYSSGGVEQWVQRYTGPGTDNDEPNAIAVDRVGNVYVTGFDDRGPNTEWVTIKYSSAGTEEWVRRYGESSTLPAMGRDLVLDSLGNVYVTGSVLNSGTNTDYTTIKYSPSGVEEWVRTYNGPAGNGDDIPYAIAIDRTGVIYVTGGSYGGAGTDGDCTTIRYSPDGVELWVRRYNSLESKYDWGWDVAVDTSGNVIVGGGYTDVDGHGHFLTLSYDSSGNARWADRYDGPGDDSDALTGLAVDLAGNAYVTGNSYGGTATTIDFATIKYSPQRISIMRPQVGERWIAGRQDTIRWTGGQAGEFVSVEYSVDNGRTYQFIELSAPADSGYHLWTHPDSLATRRARIRLSDFQSSTVLAESDTFTIKGYVLTRFTPDGDYERFLPGKHSWKFGNGDTATIWPSSWYSQFNYATGLDPFTNRPYSPEFALPPDPAAPDSFPSWPSFVDAFGTDACYWFGTYYDEAAVSEWKDHISPYNGTCYGLAGSSLLAFDNPAGFANRFPGIPTVDSLHRLFITPTIRKAIYQSFVYQFGEFARANDRANQNTTPKATVDRLKQIFLSDASDNQTLCFYDPNGTGAHQVTPIRIAGDPTNSNRVRIYLYDSNRPQSFGQFIMVDTVLNTWQEMTGFGWASGSFGMYLDIPSSAFLPRPILPSIAAGAPPGPAKIADQRVEIASSRWADVSIYSTAGDSIGSFDGRAFRSLPDALPIIPKSGIPSPPLGFDLPAGSYRAAIRGNRGPQVHFSARTGGTRRQFTRSDALPGETDLLSIGDGMTITNPDAASKRISLLTAVRTDSSNRVVEIADCLIAQNDSVAVSGGVDGQVKAANAGSEKTYQLRVRQSSGTGVSRYESGAILLPSNSAHVVAPDWSNPRGTATIYVDQGNDGTIDDTLLIANTVAVEEGHGSLQVPREYNLAQNYPNPFNPSTTIRYSLPVRSHVTLTVYNSLGQQVATLVEGEMEAGYHDVQFDAAHLASGVYLYQIRAGAFVETRKLVILR